MPPPHSWRPPKRPPRDHARHREGDRPELTRAQDIPSAAFVRAYEAQLVYGHSAFARDLYALPDVTSSSASTSAGARGALMRWEGDDGDGDDARGEVWVDRYDILHLLSSLPEAGPSTSRPAGLAGSRARSPSPALTSSSWDSAPSDTEDTFFLSGSEDLEEYERGKKRRWMEALREERLREREREDQVERKGMRGEASSSWGGADEVPSEAVLTLMSHTALALSASPNPQILEMRILANHASDERFAFLKGRWKDAWERVKAEVRKGKATAEAPKERKTVGALIGGYETSDEEEDESGDGEGPGQPGDSPPPPPPAPPPLEEPPRRPSPPDPEGRNGTGPGGVIGSDQDAEEEKRRQRRLRAEEWKRKRKLETATGN